MSTLTTKPRPSSRPTNLRRLWRSRELLRNLIVRELKVRYKNSVLGFAWSLITPLAMMVIFTFIFTQVFRSPLEDFSIYFLAGFLPWLYFSNAVQGSVGAIVGNANLIKKVAFPREVLPISTVMAQGVHFLLSLAVFAAYMLYEGYNFLPYIHVLLMAIVLQTAFNAGLAMLFASANVGFRDLQELIQVIFMLWFYATPLFYQLDQVPERFRVLLQLNPLTWLVELYRHALYYLEPPSWRLVGLSSLVSGLTLVAGFLLFQRLAVTFAKEV